MLCVSQLFQRFKSADMLEISKVLQSVCSCNFLDNTEIMVIEAYLRLGGGIKFC